MTIDKKCECMSLQVQSHTNIQATYRCACRATTITREFTPEESARYQELHRLRGENNVHRLWNKYTKEVLDVFSYNPDLIDASEKFSEQNPEVTISGCDDSYHSNSIIVMIPHIGYLDVLRDQYWGTTCLFISQCAGDPPAKYFLYPENLKQHIEDLKRMKELTDRYGTKLLFKREENLTEQDKKELKEVSFLPDTIEL